MLKTHNITGLKYLCKTSTSNPKWPFQYLGSGVYWKKHLKKHGRDVSTEILSECSSVDELKKIGYEFSKKWNVVYSDEFANLVEERGDGGPTMLGKTMSVKSRQKKSKSLKEFYRNSTPEYRLNRAAVNSKSHRIRRYYTPSGEFTSAYDAAIANKCTNVTIINRCVKDTDKIITAKRYPQWYGSTWRSLGWSSENLNA